VTVPLPPDASDDPFVRLARESGRILGELGIRADDRAWLEAHAATIASLTVPGGGYGRGGLLARLYRLARRAARTAR
jgi:hypothetical protein